MTVHLIKLCVGVDTPSDLANRIQYRIAKALEAGLEPRIVHTTRMTPKQISELLDGGSLYWVIKGNIQVRQKLLDIVPVKDNDGIKRCDLVLDPGLVLTEIQPRRAFQGWRYLKSEDAPHDLANTDQGLEIDPVMRSKLSELALL